MNMKTTLVFTFAVFVQGFSCLGLEPVNIKHPLLEALRGAGRPSHRITGGVEAVPNSIPYQVALLIPTPQGVGFCGGSLISRTVVLTAAHCAEISNTIDIVLGAHKVQDISEISQVRITATNIIIHQGWDATVLRNDIALIILPRSVQLNDNIQLVRLPAKSDVSNTFVNDLATASGWGRQSDDHASISETLRKVDVKVGSNLRCNLNYLGILQNTHICTLGDDGKSTCNGDSGGPLVSSGGKQIGIVSFGISLGCEIGWPAVYTRVTEYLDWIESNTNDVVIEK